VSLRHRHVAQTPRLILPGPALLVLGLVLVLTSVLSVAAPALAVSPHVGGEGADTCSSCHVPHQAATTRGIFRRFGEPKGEAPVCLSCHDGSGASSDIKNGPDSFGGSSGHTLEDLVDPEAATDLTNACSGCHKPHGDPALRPKLPATEINGTPVAAVGNGWCLACHDDEQSWYSGLDDYDLSDPSRDASGYPVAGVFAGASVYTDVDANPHASIPASGTTRQVGDCLYCHAAHGSSSRYDSLVATLAPSTPGRVASDRATGAYAALCFGCHGGGSWETSGAADIKRYATRGAADAGINASGGHRIKSAGGTLPVGAPLPCYDCHNPHGSSRGNASLLSDALGEGLDTSTDAGVRRFCLTCHVTSDLYGWDAQSGVWATVSSTDKVEGLRRDGGTAGHGPGGGKNWLLLKVTVGHQRDDAFSCYECHGGDYADADSNNVHNPGSYSVALHTGTPAATTITILGVDYPAQVCATCHELELGPEHAKTSSSSTADACGACHPDPRSTLTPEWDRDTCAQDGCHTASTPAPMHAEVDADHAAGANSCTGAGCHSGSGSLAVIHASASTVVEGETRTSCEVCHADGVPATSDCGTCHTGDPHPDADHTVAGPCTPSGCHVTDATVIHENGPDCAACHAEGKTPSLVCGECHIGDQHPTANHVNNSLCYGCHAEANLMTVHGDDCATCHPTPAEGMTYAGGCSQAGCHAALHPDPWSNATYEPGHSEVGWGHSDWGNDCWECHEVNSWEGTSCTTPYCHPHAYERIAPTTTSNVAGPYVGIATITLSATDAGEYWGGPDPQWFISGVKTTYFQVNGGALQTGSTIVIAPPSSGTKVDTIEFWSMDNNYNTEAHHIVSFAVSAADGSDVTAPTGTMSVNGGALYTGVVAATVNSAVTDAESGVSLMRIDPGTGTYGSWVPYSASRGITLPSGDGSKAVRAEYMDGAGNLLMLADSIILDATKPTGTMAVNNGASTTAVTGVTLNSAISDVTSGVSQMRFSNDNVTWSSWETYASTKSWTLTSGNSLKTVYAQYRDGALNVSTTISDTITFFDGVDSTPPTGAITVNGAVAYTNTTAATLILSASDTGGSGLSQMRFSNDNATWSTWESFASTRGWTLTSGSGLKTVYAQFRDGSNNVSLTYSDTIILDVLVPTGSISINSGAADTGTPIVTLTLSASDTGGSGLSQMRFSNDNVTWSSWQPYATTRSWTLSAGNGTKTVYAQFRDGALNVSATVSDTITLTNTTATLAFVWHPPDWAEAHLRVKNASGTTIIDTWVDGYGADLDLYVTVTAGQRYYMECLYYYDEYWDDEGTVPYGIWSDNVAINPDGVLSTGETVIWYY